MFPMFSPGVERRTHARLIRTLTCQSPPEVRVLPSTSITRLPRSYDPLRFPRWPPPLRSRWSCELRQAADLPQLPRPPSEDAVLTTPADRNRCLSVSSLPARPPPNLSRVGIRNFTFEACSSFTRVTACSVAHQPKSWLCHKAPIRSVAQPNRLSATTSYRQLHGWDFHHR